MRCVACGKPATALHHVVYRQELKRWGGDVNDQRNLVGVCSHCHQRHHGYYKTLPLDVLPDSVFEFASELMGAGVAYEYIRRHYGRDDPRLDVLLAEWEAAA